MHGSTFGFIVMTAWPIKYHTQVVNHYIRSSARPQCLRGVQSACAKCGYPK